MSSPRSSFPALCRKTSRSHCVVDLDTCTCSLASPLHNVKGATQSEHHKQPLVSALIERTGQSKELSRVLTVMRSARLSSGVSAFSSRLKAVCKTEVSSRNS